MVPFFIYNYAMFRCDPVQQIFPTERKMNKKLILAGALALVVSYIGLRPPADKSPQTGPPAVQQTTQVESARRGDIAALTRQERVVSYLQQHQRLPDYYVRKSEARRQGWDPASGNLCQALPGKAIGGDRFSNREGRLPNKSGRNWYEADVNYQCGRRGSDRMLWSSDGLIYLTHDHYRHFTQVN